MRITELEIENFRAIRHAAFTDLASTVVVAGPNGCGKSATLDAIRLLKSACGEYRRGELQNFFSEFGIPIREGTFVAQKLLRDPAKPLKIRARFRLAQPEIEFLQREATRLLRPFVIRALNPASNRDEPTLLRADGDLPLKFEQRLSDEVREFSQQLRADNEYVASIESEVGTGILKFFEVSDILHVLFSTFEPTRLGVFDFHGANRSYQREQLTQIKFVRDEKPTQSQHALYQTENKYKNIKQEMASSYLRELIAIKAGIDQVEGSDLTSTLKGLFRHLFPR